MKNSKLISLLSAFSSGEMARFAEFVRSPYYNNNEVLGAFLDYLALSHPGFPESRLGEEQAYAAVYSGEEFDKKKLGYLMSGLLKLAEHFMGVQRLEKQEILFNCYSIRELAERGMEKHYNRLFKEAKENLRSREREDGHSFFHQYLLSETALFFPVKQKIPDHSLQAASDALDDYYFINKLKYGCEMLNRQAIVSDQFSIPFIGEVRDYLLKARQLKPLLAIYLQIYLSLAYPDEPGHIAELLRLIRENSPYIENPELKNIYLYTINICMRKLREGKEKYLQLSLELYEEGILNKALLDNDILSHWTYNNIVKLALRLDRFDWIEQFIYSYNGALQKEYQEDALHYNLAELYFHQKNYDEALLHLHQVHARDVKYHLVSRILLIKTFYESGAVDACLSTLAAFTVYLSRSKQIATPLKRSCQHFCTLLHHIMAYSNSKKREKLREAIVSRQPLADRAWLMEALENRRVKL